MKNIGEAFTYQFKDKDWVSKFLMGSLFAFLSMFIIPIPILMGYMIQNVRNVMDNKKDPLPKWDDIGSMFKDGLKLFVGLLGYMLPIVILVFLIMIFVGLGIVFEEEAFFVIMIIPMLLLYGLIMIYSLAMQFIYPIIYIKYAKTGEIKSLYQFKEIFSFLKKNFVNILIFWVLSFATAMIVNLGMLVLFIGLFPAMYYSLTIMAHLTGQIYLESKK